jgi:SAM-dependent methyltransferase
MSQHELHDAALGFATGAGAYERARPSYPPEAIALIVDKLALGPSTTLVDLAAGTGKLTRLLAPTGARIIAVEPVEGMRRELAEKVPGIEVRDGTAEHMPLDDGAAGALTVGQAFHWFDFQKALAEIARVLRPGGGMAMVWNRRDESTPWVARMSEIIEWHDRPLPKYDAIDWEAEVAAAGAFTPLLHVEVPYEHVIDRAMLRDRVYSVSYIAKMDEAERTRLGDEVVALADDFDEQFVMPYVTRVYWCHRVE